MAYKKSKKKRKTQEATQAVDELFNYVDRKAQDAMHHTSQWSTNQQKWHKLRMRIKKPKTFPFIGCSNLRMPTAETKIRKLKAALHNIIFGIRPIIQATPSPSGNLRVAAKIEKFMDHLVSDVMNFPLQAIIAIDQELEKGFYILKPYWHVEIVTRVETFKLKDISLQEAVQLYNSKTTPEQIIPEIIKRFQVDMSDMVAEDNQMALEEMARRILSGEDNVEMAFQDVTYNFPKVALCSPERVYVPSDSGFDPQECQCIIHELFIPPQVMEYNVKHKGWDEIAKDEIMAQKDVDIKKLTDIDKDMREGIERLNNPSSQIRIWEYYGWYDLGDGNGLNKVVITTAPDFKKVLHKMALPFLSGKFPFVKLVYEMTDDRWFSHRGIAEIIEDIIKEIDVQHMQKIDQQTIRNAPMFMYRAGMVNPNLVQFVPNQGIPVNGMNPLRDTLDVLNNNNPNVEYSYEREQMLLESKIEELIGQVDFTLQSMINRRQPRTLGEVQLQNQNMQQVFSLDAFMHTSAFADLFNWIWDLWCQYGDDEYEFNYFGKDGWEPIKLTKEEIQGKYKITVRGNDQNTNPQVKLQKAQQILMAVTNPTLLQTGVITPIQQAAGLKRFYQALDIIEWEELINQKIQPPQPQPNVSMKMDDLTDAEQAQVLAKSGVQPDVQGRQLKSQEKLREKSVEFSKSKADTAKSLADIVNMIGGEDESEPAE